MTGRAARWFCPLAVLAIAGCGGENASPSASRPAGPRRVQFVGFDASAQIVEAIRGGQLQGAVAQNPIRMGELGVTMLLNHLEKKPVEKKVETGETMITPENIDSPEVAHLVNPPRVPHTQNAGLGGRKTKKWRVMVIPKGTSHEFWLSIHAGALKAAEEHGDVEVIWQGPLTEDQRGVQIQLVQDAVAVGVDGIVLAPLDAKALVEPVEQAIARGIPVVIIDSGLESDKVVSTVSTDNYNGGVLGARRLGALLKGEGRIILLRYAAGSESTIRREQGFLDTMAKEFPRVTYLSNDQYGGATANLAQEKSQDLVARFRDQIDGVFCVNESNTMGMLRALEGAGLLAAPR